MCVCMQRGGEGRVIFQSKMLGERRRGGGGELREREGESNLPYSYSYSLPSDISRNTQHS